MARRTAGLLLVFALTAPARPNPVEKQAPKDLFVVAFSSHLTFLDGDGNVKDSFGPRCIRGSFTPDRRRLATIEFEGEPVSGKVMVRPYGQPGDDDAIPLVFGTPASSGAWLIWSGDGKRLLICESSFI